MKTPDKMHCILNTVPSPPLMQLTPFHALHLTKSKRKWRLKKMQKQQPPISHSQYLQSFTTPSLPPFPATDVKDPCSSQFLWVHAKITSLWSFPVKDWGLGMSVSKKTDTSRASVTQGEKGCNAFNFQCF